MTPPAGQPSLSSSAPPFLRQRGSDLFPCRAGTFDCSKVPRGSGLQSPAGPRHPFPCFPALLPKNFHFVHASFTNSRRKCGMIIPQKNKTSSRSMSPVASRRRETLISPLIFRKSPAACCRAFVLSVSGSWSFLPVTSPVFSRGFFGFVKHGVLFFAAAHAMIETEIKSLLLLTERVDYHGGSGVTRLLPSVWAVLIVCTR